jgi:predicted alpha-1,6-mannanase (GH76 family)
MKNIPTLLLSTAALLVAGSNSCPAQTFTATQATAIWNSFNNAFYVGNNGDAYYRKDEGGGQDTIDFWYNSEELEMAIDRAARSGSSGDKAIVTALVNGFDSTFGTDWTGVIYNDDVMWAALAHLRAYFVTGSTESSWAVEAANNFNWVFNGNHSPNRTEPQYDNTYGGGMWWTTDHSTNGTKNACVNGPAALVAYYCSVIWPSGTGFLSQSQEMYDWEKATLVTSSGYVYDHTGVDGVTGYDLSYNAGTFIGAGYYLGDTSTPGLVASYFKNNCCGAGGILPDYGTGGGNDDGFNGIFMRWMAFYMEQTGTQSTYSTWLYDNAVAAISVEDSSGLSWDDWFSDTPSSGQYSWDCSDSVVALQVLPPN